MLDPDRNALSRLFDLYIAANKGDTFLLEEALIGFGEKLDPQTREDFATLTSAIDDAIANKNGSRFTIVAVLLLVAYKAQLDKDDLISSSIRMQDFLLLFSNLLDCVIPSDHPKHPQSRKDLS